MSGTQGNSKERDTVLTCGLQSEKGEGQDNKQIYQLRFVTRTMKELRGHLMANNTVEGISLNKVVKEGLTE